MKHLPWERSAVGIIVFSVCAFLLVGILWRPSERLSQNTTRLLVLMGAVFGFGYGVGYYTGANRITRFLSESTLEKLRHT